MSGSFPFHETSDGMAQVALHEASLMGLLCYNTTPMALPVSSFSQDLKHE